MYIIVYIYTHICIYICIAHTFNFDIMRLICWWRLKCIFQVRAKSLQGATQILHVCDKYVRILHTGMHCYQSNLACSDWTESSLPLNFLPLSGYWYKSKRGGHPRAIWAVTNPWLIMHLFWGIIHDNSSTILFFSGVIMTHYGNFYQLDRGCWTLLAGDKHAQSKTRSIFPTICGWWISRGSQGFSRCRRWWRSLPTSWCSCAFWDSWCILGAFLVHSWCSLGAFLVHSWCILGAFLVHSWCILGAFRCPRARRGGLHQLFSTASALPRSSKDSFNIWKCIHAWTWSLAQSKLPLEICSTSAWFSCRLGCKQWRTVRTWSLLNTKPAISEHFETMHSSTYSLLSQGAWVGSFYVQISLVLWHQSGSGWYSQDWPGWHIGHSAQTSSLALAARCW